MLFHLRKIDARERRVFACLDETPDRVGEIMDYATSKPEIARWSEEMRKASGGKSLGNVRAMHQLDAVGIVEAIDFDDQRRAVDLAIKVIDDDAWRKCETGVFTGISPGGKYVKRWPDGAHTRYTAALGEMSLVDRPMIPSATFSLIKADGSEEERPFADEQSRIAADLAGAATAADLQAIVTALSAPLVKAIFADEAVRCLATVQLALTKRDYDEDERKAMAKKGEAEDDGSYPIANKEDLEKAIHAYGRSKDPAKTKAHIIARAKALKATDLLPEDWEGSTKKKIAKVAVPASLRKGLDDVAQMSNLVQGLSYLCSCMTAEAARENDGSPLPGRLAAAIGEIADILVAVAGEETREIVTALKGKVVALPSVVMAQAARIADLAKAGARHSKADMDRVQAIHDHARDLGADCGEMAQVARGGALGAAFTGAALRADLKKVSDERDLLKRRVAALERTPEAGGPVLRSIDRGADRGGAPAASLSSAETEERARIDKMPAGPDRALEETRWALQHPEIPIHHRRAIAQR